MPAVAANTMALKLSSAELIFRSSAGLISFIMKSLKKIFGSHFFL